MREDGSITEKTIRVKRESYLTNRNKKQKLQERIYKKESTRKNLHSKQKKITE